MRGCSGSIYSALEPVAVKHLHSFCVTGFGRAQHTWADARQRHASQRQQHTRPKMQRVALCALLARATAVRRGDTAPVFAGENYDGAPVTLESASGPKGLVLWFYPKADTGG